MASIIDSIKGWFRKRKGEEETTPNPVVTKEPSTQPGRPRAQRPHSGERSNTVSRNGGARRNADRRRPPRSGGQQERRPVRESGPRVQAPTPIQHPWDPSRSVVPPLEGKTRFHDLDLPSEMMHALADLEFQYCTPVQAELMPKTLQGLDATGRAQTGTGKTAAFLLTIFTLLLRKPAEAQRKPGTPRALILAPTRELVMQIEKDALALGKYCPGIRALAIFGGTDYAKQKRKLEQGPVDIIVATPGRLLDFKSKGGLMLSKVEVMVIDEADRMLDMGFIPDVRRIIESTPPKTRRQTLLFSATLTPEVVRLASKWTKDAITVEIDPEHVATDSVDQVVYIVTADEKFRVLYNTVTQQKLERVIVFCNRRDESQRLAERFAKMGVSTGLLSGDVSQDRRIKTLEAFRSGQIRVMVATDVAARGLHIEDISHVVNYYMPLNPEDYVHRIGRTGRAGAKGISVSFADEMGAQQLPAIEKYMGRPLTAVYPDQSLLGDPVPLKDSPAPLIIEKAVRHEDRNRRRTGRPQGRRPGGSGPHRRRPGGAGGGEGKQGA